MIGMIPQGVKAQVDTTALKKAVFAIESRQDHNRFWRYLYNRDQSFRGSKTSKSIDLENMISAIYYIKRFGYPSEQIKGSDILPYIWIHSPYPEVDRLTFPIILEGYKAGRISEQEIRYQFLRNMHWQKYFNTDNRTKDLILLFQDLDLSVDSDISIENVLNAYDHSEEFVNQDFKVIGHWIDLNEDTSYKILKSKNEEYYFYDLYIDGSYYPELIIQDKEYTSLFRNRYNKDFYFGIQPNGDLTIKNYNGTKNYKPCR